MFLFTVDILYPMCKSHSTYKYVYHTCSDIWIWQGACCSMQKAGQTTITSFILFLGHQHAFILFILHTVFSKFKNVKRYKFPEMICQEEIFQFYLCLLLKRLYIMDSQMVLLPIETLKMWNAAHYTDLKKEKASQKHSLHSKYHALSQSYTLHVTHQRTALAFLNASDLVWRSKHPLTRAMLKCIQCNDTWDTEPPQKSVCYGFCVLFCAGFQWGVESNVILPVHTSLLTSSCYFSE